MLRFAFLISIVLSSLACQPLQNTYDSAKMDCGDDALPDVSYARLLGPDGQRLNADDVSAFLVNDGQTDDPVKLTRHACIPLSTQEILVRSRDKRVRLSYLGKVEDSSIRLRVEDHSLSVSCDGVNEVRDTWTPGLALSGPYGIRAFNVSLKTEDQTLPLMLRNEQRGFPVGSLTEGKHDVRLVWQNLFSQETQVKDCRLQIDRSAPEVVLDSSTFSSPGRVAPMASLRFKMSEPSTVHYCLREQNLPSESCEYSALKGDTLVAPVVGEWVLQFFVKDSAGNASPHYETRFAIFNTDRLNTIQRIIQLADTKLQTFEPLQAARLVLEAHSWSDTLSTPIERGTVDRLIRNAYWALGLNLHAARRINLQDPYHGISVCGSWVALYRSSGRLELFDSQGQQIWSVATTPDIDDAQQRMQWSHNCKTIVTNFGPLMAWDTQGRATPLAFERNQGLDRYTFEFSSDDRYLLIKSGNHSYSDFTLYSMEQHSVVGPSQPTATGKATFVSGSTDILVCSGSIMLNSDDYPEGVDLGQVFRLQLIQDPDHPKVERYYLSPQGSRCHDIVAVNQNDVLIVETKALQYLHKGELIASIASEFRPRMPGKKWFVLSPSPDDDELPYDFHLLDEDPVSGKDLNLRTCFVKAARCGPIVRVRDIHSFRGGILQVTENSLSWGSERFRVSSDILSVFVSGQRLIIKAQDELVFMAPWDDFDYLEHDVYQADPDDPFSLVYFTVSRDKGFLYPSQVDGGDDGWEGSYMKPILDLGAPPLPLKKSESDPLSYMLLQGSERSYCAFAVKPQHELRDCENGEVVMKADRFLKGLDGKSVGALQAATLSVFSYADLVKPVQTMGLERDERPEIFVMLNYVVVCPETCFVKAAGKPQFPIPARKYYKDFELYENFVLVRESGQASERALQLFDVMNGEATSMDGLTVSVQGYGYASRSRPENQLVLHEKGNPNAIVLFQGRERVSSSRLNSRIKGPYETAFFNSYLTRQITTAGSSELNEIHDLQNPDMVIRWPVANQLENNWAYPMGSMGEGLDGLLLFERGKVLKLSYSKDKLRLRLCSFIRHDLSKGEIERLCPAS